MTLQELYDQHPEWRHLPLVVYAENGDYHYLGRSGMVYTDKDNGRIVLVMSPNELYPL